MPLSILIVVHCRDAARAHPFYNGRLAFFNVLNVLVDFPLVLEIVLPHLLSSCLGWVGGAQLCSLIVHVILMDRCRSNSNSRNRAVRGRASVHFNCCALQGCRWSATFYNATSTLLENFLEDFRTTPGCCCMTLQKRWRTWKTVGQLLITIDYSEKTF